MRFGIDIPACTAGLMHPARFATAVEAEQLGFHAVGVLPAFPDVERAA